MRFSKFTSIVVVLLLYVVPCRAQYTQYAKYYTVESNTYVTTNPMAKLYRLPESQSSEEIFSLKREFVDIDGLQIKNLKKSISLPVLKYTNTQKKNTFNAYVVEYKNKLWILQDLDVQDNSLLNERSVKMLQDRNDVLITHNVLKHRLDGLNKSCDSLSKLCRRVCEDSLNYYKILRARLPQIRDSLLLVTKKQEEERAQKLYKEWYDKQPASTQKAAKVITITNSELEYPNSAGGCDYSFYYINNSNKTIKYLYVNGVVYNAVNDQVYCDVRHSSTFSGKDTGPITQGSSGGGGWSNIIYNYSARTLKLTSVTISYMDGSSVSIGAADLRRLMNAPSTRVYVSTYNVSSKIMSDDACRKKIDYWQDYVYKTYDTYKLFNKSVSTAGCHSVDQMLDNIKIKNIEIEKVKKELENTQERSDEFNKFIKFETYSNNEKKGYLSNNNNGSSSRNNSLSAKKEPFVTVGLEGSFEGLKSFSTGWGLSMRVGKFSSRLNAIIGLKYQYTGYKEYVSYLYDDYYGTGQYEYDIVYGGADYQRNVNQFVFPILVNLNVIRGYNTSCYLGLGYEFGVLLSDNYSFNSSWSDFNETEFYKSDDADDLTQLCVPNRMLVLQMGLAGRHCDWKVYYKINTDVLNLSNVEKGAIGTAFTYYF